MMARHMTTNESSIFLLSKALYSVKHTSDDLQWAINFFDMFSCFSVDKIFVFFSE